MTRSLTIAREWDMNSTSIAFAAITLVFSNTVNATIVTFNDQSAFLSATGATSATGTIPDLGKITGGTQTLGDVTISLGSGATQLFIGATGTSVAPDWTSVNPGNDIALSGIESINVDFVSPVYSAGFEFVEPSDSTCYAPCFDSTFNVILKNGGVTVDSFTFNAPDDVLAFIGVWSDSAFDRLEIIDLTATVDDEYYGEIFAGARSLVPIPAAVWLFSSGLIGLISFAGLKHS